MKKILTKKNSLIFAVFILITCIILGREAFINDVRTKSNVNTQINIMPKKENPSIPDISIEEVINILCSDKFEGRLVGTKGNDYTVQYISDIFQKLKLDFVFQNSYLEEYPFKVPNEDKPGSRNIKPQNVIGKIPGGSSKNAVIISAHLDHIGIQDGKLYKGALDNASGTAALLKIAYILIEASNKKAFDFDIVICDFNGEECGLSGSKAFVKAIKTQYNKLYNINIDCIGSIDGGNLALKNLSKVADSEKLYEGIKNTMETQKIKFSNTAICEDAVREGIGIGDHGSFEKAGIPNVFIVQEGIKPLVHKVTDTPEKLDCNKIEKISSAICDFIENNGSIIF